MSESSSTKVDAEATGSGRDLISQVSWFMLSMCRAGQHCKGHFFRARAAHS